MSHMKTCLPLLLILGLVALTGCPGSVMQPLPPGGGQGDYIGRFTDEADTIVMGSFEMEIDDLGVMEGSGLLNGRTIEIRGVLSNDEIDGYIDDTLIHTTGRFEGRRTGSGYIGEFNLDQGPSDPDVFGYWDAAVDSN